MKRLRPTFIKEEEELGAERALKRARWRCGTGVNGSDGNGDLCDECASVAAVARQTQDLPTRATYELLALLATCPNTGAAYRRGLLGETAVPPPPHPQVDEKEEEEEEDTVDWPGTPSFLDAPEPAKRQVIPKATPLSMEFDIPMIDLFQDPLGQTMHTDSAILAKLEAEFAAAPVVAAPWRQWTEADQHALQEKFDHLCEEHNHMPRDDRARTDFTDTKHDYYIDSVLVTAANGWYTASGMDKKLWPHFDQHRAAERASKGKNPEYAGKTKEQIIDGWERNKNRGSAKHRGYECWLRRLPLVDEVSKQPVEAPPLGFYEAMQRALDEYELDIFRLEWTLFDEDAKALGQTDVMFVHRRTGEIFVGDWKNCNSDDLADESKCRGEKGTHWFTVNMLATKLNKYRVQLSWYRELAVRKYFVGDHYRKVSTKMLLFNFNPKEPRGHCIYELEALDMAPLWSLLPWHDNDPRHRQLPPAVGGIWPVIPDDDPDVQTGATRRLIGPPVGALEPDIVWTGNAYAKNQYNMPDGAPWKHPSMKWFGPPPPLVCPTYEQHLLKSPDLLGKLPAIIGKRIACWCRTADQHCHADVLVKYARAYEHKADFRAMVDDLTTEKREM